MAVESSGTASPWACHAPRRRGQRSGTLDRAIGLAPSRDAERLINGENIRKENSYRRAQFPKLLRPMDRPRVRPDRQIPRPLWARFWVRWGDDSNSTEARPAIIEEVKREYAKVAMIALTWHAVRPTPDDTAITLLKVSA